MTADTEPTKFYSREVKMPVTKRDGLANFVQIIINRIESGDHNEALLGAVDLLEDISCGLYDAAMSDANGHSALVKELQDKHAADIIAAAQKGREDGIREEQARMSKALGLIAA